MQLSQETSRAAEYLRDIFQSGKALKLTGPNRLSGSQAFAFTVTAYGRESDFCLTSEQLDDVPGTKEYREAADVLARILEFRFRNTDPNLFLSTSGRLLHISPDWPALPLPNSDGTGYIAANGTRVLVKDALSYEVAICLVKMTHMQTFPGPNTTPFHRFAGFINSVRADVDAGKIVFHRSLEEHPKVMQNVDFRYDAKAPQTVTLSGYIQQKVWLLGFRSGKRDTKVWIADPWDAAYLASAVPLLLQEAAILDAQELINLDESEEFASAGKLLLAQQGPQPPTPVHSAPPPTAPLSRPEFDVFISHSTVDKPYVEPLVKELEAAGISVWFDKTTIEWGDSLRSEIDRGLAACRYGIVVFSKAFLNKKKWTEHELNALFAREEPGKKVILPIWHGIRRDDLVQYSPAFADRLAKNSVTDSYADIVQSLLAMLGRPVPLIVNTVAVTPQVGSVTGPKPSAVVHARYETKKKDAIRVHIFIRPVPQMPGQFTFENPDGEIRQGDVEEVALDFLKCDRALTAKGCIRMEFGNLSGNRRFDL